MAITKKLYYTSLVIIILVRILMVIGFVNGIPESLYHEDWYFHHGGDNLVYYELAKSISEFNPIDSFRTLGFPLILVPFIWLFGVEEFEDLVFPVVFFHSIILASFSIILIAWVAFKLFKKRSIALLSVTIWVLLPYIIYLSLLLLTKQNLYAGMYASHQMWLQVLTEPISVFLLLLSLYLYMLGQEKNNKLLFIFSGFFFGILVMTRILSILFGFIFLYLTLKNKNNRIKDLKYFILFGVISFIAFLPQLIYNWKFNGSIFKFSYVKFLADFRIEGGPQAFLSKEYLYVTLQNIIEIFPSIAIGITILVTTALLIIISYVYLFRRHKKVALFSLTWIFPYFLFFSFSVGFVIEPLRFIIPILPIISILASYFISDFVISLNKLSKYT